MKEIKKKKKIRICSLHKVFKKKKTTTAPWLV